MKKIVVLGAGRSATVLIDDLKAHALVEDYNVVVADADMQVAKRKCGDHDRCTAIAMDGGNQEAIAAAISGAHIVVSLLPPKMHYQVAQLCLLESCSMLTASYVDDSMRGLNAEFEAKGLFMLGEMGLDPGIDHMSSMILFDQIQKQGGRITSYRSSTGGLVAPESDTNPWHYKFSWNPRNVVTAGSGTAQFLKDGAIRYVPYQRIFKSLTQENVEGVGLLESYPNRNSLIYADYYGLKGLETLYRGTYRMPGFCSSWNALLQIGYTSDHFFLNDLRQITYAELTRRLLGTDKAGFEAALNAICESDFRIVQNLEWLGIFSDQLIPLECGTPADVLENLLLRKWSMEPGDKDMIVMQHEVDYTVNGNQYKLISSLIEKGQDDVHTAMAKLVGLPMSIFARHYMRQGTSLLGVRIPVMQEVYNPVLQGLEHYGSRFSEQIFQLS